MTQTECVLAYLALCEEDTGTAALNDAVTQGKAYQSLTPEQRLDMAAEIGPPPQAKRPGPSERTRAALEELSQKQPAQPR